MTAGEALVYLLGNSFSNVVAYPLVVPGGTIVPAIAYQQISETPVMSQDGFANMQMTRYQLTIQAPTYVQMRTLARAIKRQFNGYTGTLNGLKIWSIFVENDQDDYSVPAMQPVARMDLLITHDEH